MGYADVIELEPAPTRPRLALWPRNTLDELRAITGGWTLMAGAVTEVAIRCEPLHSRPICPECRQKLGQNLLPLLTTAPPRRLALLVGVSGWEYAGDRMVDGNPIPEVQLTKRNLRSRKWALGSRLPASAAKPTTDWRRDDVGQTPLALPLIIECQSARPFGY